MSPNITLASIPKLDADEKMFDINPTGLNLIDFEVSPHSNNSKRENKELTEYSEKTKNLIIAIPDGSGLIVEKNKVAFLGKANGFIQGKKFKL